MCCFPRFCLGVSLSFFSSYSSLARFELTPASFPIRFSLFAPGLLLRRRPSPTPSAPCHNRDRTTPKPRKRRLVRCSWNNRLGGRDRRCVAQRAHSLPTVSLLFASAGEDVGHTRSGAPKAGTLAQMLAQALHSNDQALLDEVRAGTLHAPDIRTLRCQLFSSA